MMIIVTTVAIFTAGQEVAGVLWIYAPAYYHATQYLAISIAQHMKELSYTGEHEPDRVLRLTGEQTGMDYYVRVMIVATALYVGLPSLLHLFGIPFALAFANVFCVLSLHHFLTDMAIWKLRDPKVHETLI